MTSLAGKTLFITGGSRGIGLAIGLRAASAGANIVIVAKEEPDQSLEAAAKQIFAVGGKVLPLNVDVRDEHAIEAAVEKAAKHFGGIDILINNVGAVCFLDTVTISPKQLDLLLSVNIRATFLASRACIPFLKQASNPHIITISPPLDMDPKWFKNHVAFSLAKYGLSLCTLGMAAEFEEDGIAVNSLWPQTTIASNIVKDHFVSKVYAGSRWPTIMGDAAYEIMQKEARTCTGQFFIDETLLREAGVIDFSHYAVDPSAPLVEDLFVPSKNQCEMTLETNLFLEKNPARN